MRRCLCLLFLVLSVAGYTWDVSADEFYIAPGGSNGSPGTIGSPWATFDYAIDHIDPGDTLYVRGGTYSLTSRIRIQSNEGGTSVNPINIWAYPGESPVLDFAGMSNSLWGSSSGRGIQIDDGADWLHIKGLTVQNARDNGIYSESDNSVFEQVTTRWNGDSGLQLDGFSSYNLVLNADSYENYDPSNNGENADGFAIKFADLGPGNVVRGSRAWGNSDDGWDMWESTTGGVLVEDSWSFDNGKLIQRFFDVDALEFDNLTAGSFNGDGNGFKLGQDGGPHVLNRVVVWENQTRGIDVNGNGYGVQVSNSTVYNSGRNWQFDETAAETLNQHILRNNVSLAGTSSDIFDTGVTDTFNTWNGIPVDASDFLSLDDTIARGPRNPDGSLPVSDFLRLAPGSNLIDTGTDVGLPFNGTAPDLGAFETEEVSNDFNGDGRIDSYDFLLWQRDPGVGNLSDWQANYGTPTVAATTAVPEPSGLVLALAGLALATRWRR